MVVLTSFTQPMDGIRHQQQNTVVYVNNNNLGKGTLYIAESRLSWIGESGNGFSIEYPHIALHAISRDLSAFPQECLFLMLDTSLEDEDQNSEEDGNADGDDLSRQDATEMRLVPDDRGMLDAMFHAMNACQALHPDPEDSFSDEDFFEDADDESPMEEADSQMARLIIGNMDGRAHIEALVEELVEGPVEGPVEGTVEGTVEGILDRPVEGLVGRPVEGLVGRPVERLEERPVEGLVGRPVEGLVEGLVKGRVEGRAEGRAEDMGEGMEGGLERGIGEGMEGAIGEGLGEGSIQISRARGADMEVGTEVGTEVGMELGMARDDRSIFLVSTLHRDSTVEIPVAHSFQLCYSNFHDDEN